MALIFTCSPAAKTALKPDYAGILVWLQVLRGIWKLLGDQLSQVGRPANQFSLVWNVCLFSALLYS